MHLKDADSVSLHRSEGVFFVIQPLKFYKTELNSSHLSMLKKIQIFLFSFYNASPINYIHRI
jgi:hypothetical protein